MREKQSFGSRLVGVKVAKAIWELADADVESWSRKTLGLAERMVLLAAEETGRTELGIALWCGPQGTGKGTNIQALVSAAQQFSPESGPIEMSPDLARLVRLYAGGLGLVITGTGGIFVPPAEGEYQQLFSRLAPQVKEWTAAGNLVPDAMTSAMVTFMLARRIFEGCSVVQPDTWPRTTRQYEHMRRLFGELAEIGIATTFAVVDLHLLDRKALDRMAANKPAYANAAQTLGPALKKMAGTEVTAATREEMRDDLLRVNPGGEMRDLWGEAREAMGRVAIRAEKEGRQDDTKMSAVLIRLASYYSTTLPFILSLGGDTRFVSSLQSPADVMRDLLRVLAPDAVGGAGFEEFVKVAGWKAEEIVAKNK